jgi:RND family efflux transporter MFP subunit
VRGVIRPRDEVMFASKMAGRIAQMPWREGERFKKGALLVGFDCDRLHAQIRAAHAAHRAATQLAAQNRELDRYQAIGRHEVAISQAKADQAGAEAAALEVQQRDCVIHAPFDGLVVETSARLHQNAALGQDLMKVLATGDLEVHLVVPSAWLAWLEPGKAFAFRVDETARRYAAKVTRIGASVDPVSQTVKIVGVFTGERTGVLPGMSGSADFPQADPALAHATPR